MPPRKLFDEYESGWMAVRGRDEFFVQTPDGEEISFGSSAIGSNRRRVRLFAALCVKFGRVPRLENPRAIPVHVAAAGKPEMAAYLLAVHYDFYSENAGYYPKGIAAIFDVSYETVSKYCSRVLRSVDDRRVGGIYADSS